MDDQATQQPTANPRDLAEKLATLRLSREVAPLSAPGSGRGLRAVLAVVLLLLLSGGVYLGRGAWIGPRTVQVAPVVRLQPGAQAPLFVATGTLIAPITATLAPRLSGRLARLLVQEAEEVQPQQAVAVLEDTEVRFSLLQAQASLTAAQAKVALAQATYNSAELRAVRAGRLSKTGAGTESDAQDTALALATERAQLAVAASEVGMAQVHLALALKDREDMTLRAPFHGVVLRLLAQPGDFVAAAASQGVLRLANLADLEVDAEVAEVNLGKLTERMAVEVRLDAQPNHAYAGEVFAVRPNVDPAKATVIAKVRLQLPEHPDAAALYPGMNARVGFLARPAAADALAGPPQLQAAAAALVQVGAETIVYTVDDGGRVTRVPVVVGDRVGDHVTLLQGPAAGSLLIVSPERLQDGDQVRVVGSN